MPGKADHTNLPLTSEQYKSFQRALAKLGIDAKKFPAFVAKVLHRELQNYPVITTQDAARLAQVAQKEHDEREAKRKLSENVIPMFPELMQEGGG